MKFKKFELIIEWQTKSEFVVIVPTIIFFLKGTKRDYTDITFAWIRFGITLRINDKL